MWSTSWPRVRDKRGALVPNLEKKDFTILEDGKPQTIKYFTKETDLPLTIGLLVDVSGSQRNLIDIERNAASQFFSPGAAQEGRGVPDQLRRRGRTAAGLHQLAAPADRGAEPAARQLRRQRPSSRPGADRRQPARHRAVRRRLSGGQREAEDRGGPQGDRGDHRWRGPGQPADASTRRSRRRRSPTP